MKGKLIVLEGPSGTGKTTLASELSGKFNFEYFHSLSQWETINYKHGHAAALQYLSDIRYLIDEINDVLESELNVLLDRYVPSTYAHQYPQMTTEEQWQVSRMIEYTYLKPDLTVYVLPKNEEAWKTRLADRSKKSDPDDIDKVLVEYRSLLTYGVHDIGLRPFVFPAFIVDDNNPGLAADAIQSLLDRGE